MAGEHSETTAHGDEGSASTNGASGLSYEQIIARDRAAFLEEGGGADDAADEASSKKPAKPSKSKPVDEDEHRDESDDDADLDDDEDADEVASDDDTDADDDSDNKAEDDDSDLDEDDDEEKGGDSETSKRLEQVKRTDKRLREKREADFEAREQKLRKLEADIEAAWKPRVEKAEKFERLAERAKTHAADVLLELGLTEDDLEYAARDIYAHSKKGSEDPKNKEAAARSRREREQAEEIRRLKDRLDNREKTEAERQKEADERKAIDAHLDRFASAAKKTDRYPLARSYLAKNPQAARADLEVVAGRLAQQLRAMPSDKDVIKAFEKDRRRVLREHGIDPKKFTASSSAAITADTKKTATTKTTPKTGDKTTAEKQTTKPISKDDFIARKFD